MPELSVTYLIDFHSLLASNYVFELHIAVIIPTKMVQLKRMRGFIWKSIIKIEDLEQRVSQDSVREYYSRTKVLLQHKLKMSYGDRKITKKLYNRVRRFPFDLGLQLDEAKEQRRKMKLKAQTRKSIIRHFIHQLKSFARDLEDGLSERYTEEDEKSVVRKIAKLASANLKINSTVKSLISGMDQKIELLQKICDLEEKLFRERII